MKQMSDLCDSDKLEAFHFCHACIGTRATQPASKPGNGSKSDTKPPPGQWVNVGWAELRDTLAQWLPEGTVQLSKHFTSLEQHDGHVVVHFADGAAVSAKVVVGAEGCFSQVHQHTLDDGPPKYTVQA